MKKTIILVIVCFGLALSIQNMLPAIIHRNINMGTNKDLESNPKTSAIVIEDSSEFSEGTLENLTISDNGYLMLEDKFPFQPNWTNMAPSPSPNPREGHSMAYNSKYDKVILFGGASGGDETWVYDLGTNAWTEMTPSAKPTAREAHSMAYNSKYDKVILFGGFDGANNKDDTWAYDLDTNTWTNMTISNPPNARMLHSMVYNSKYDKVILFGGWGPFSGDDTWVYDLETNTWTNMDPSTDPGMRFGYSMAYNSKYDKVILFGGNMGEFGPKADETWAYDLATNTWTNMAPSTAPSQRVYQSMVYNSKYDKVILFGGQDASGNDDETWTYDLGTNAWTEMTPSAKPTARISHSMTYDSKNDKVILFGGSSGGDETWVFRLFEYHQTGKFDSRITSLDGIHKFSGEISWSPENQTVGTNLTVQIGFSNTKNEEDFTYTSPENSTFTFEGVAHYFRYRVNFESTNDFALSPMLENIMIDYVIKIESAQSIINIDESEGDTNVSEDYLLEMILVSCLIGVGSVLVYLTVLYKKKINLLEKPTKLKGRDLKSKR